MRLKELLEKLKGLPDDTVVRIDTGTVEVCVIGVDIENDGSDGCEAEVLLY